MSRVRCERQQVGGLLGVSFGQESRRPLPLADGAVREQADGATDAQTAAASTHAIRVETNDARRAITGTAPARGNSALRHREAGLTSLRLDRRPGAAAS